uniref:Uncharacterized protein n=1 Tax=Aegilops tauschii subsp. strangulata TaxID=200361 RepID=A0A452ZCD1_AEGTS
MDMTARMVVAHGLHLTHCTSKISSIGNKESRGSPLFFWQFHWLPFVLSENLL